MVKNAARSEYFPTFAKSKKHCSQYTVIIDSEGNTVESVDSIDSRTIAQTTNLTKIPLQTNMEHRLHSLLPTSLYILWLISLRLCF